MSLCSLSFCLPTHVFDGVNPRMRRFIAFNRWPCKEPLKLSKKIPVIHSVYWGACKWVVVLKKIVVSEYNSETKEWEDRGDVIHIAETGTQMPVHALLDCGTSFILARSRQRLTMNFRGKHFPTSSRYGEEDCRAYRRYSCWPT